MKDYPKTIPKSSGLLNLNPKLYFIRPQGMIKGGGFFPSFLTSLLFRRFSSYCVFKFYLPVDRSFKLCETVVSITELVFGFLP